MSSDFPDPLDPLGLNKDPIQPEHEDLDIPEDMSMALEPVIPQNYGTPAPVTVGEDKNNLLSHSSLREDNVPEDRRVELPEFNMPASATEKQRRLVEDAVKDVVLLGAQASAMICEGNQCPYAKKCPLLRQGLPVPIGDECPIEIYAMRTWMQAQMREMEINPHDVGSFYDVVASQAMTGLLLQVQRARWGEALNPILEQTMENIMGAGQNAIINVVKIGNYNCVEENTPVLKYDLTWIRAGDLNVGDELLAFDEERNSKGKTGQRRWRRSTVLANSVDQRDCVEIDLGKHGKLISTDNHKWLMMTPSSTRPIWRESSDLKYGDILLLASDVWEEERSWEAGWLAGMLDGEGCASQGKIVINQKPGPVFDLAVKLAKQLYPHGIGTSSSSGTSPTHCLRFNGKAADRIALLGRIRSRRLIKNWLTALEGKAFQSKDWHMVQSVSPVGLKNVAVLGTSTKTYIAAGYAAHNTDYREKALKMIDKIGKSNMQTRERKAALTKAGWKDKSKHAAEVTERLAEIREVEEKITGVDSKGLPIALSRIKRFSSGNNNPDID